MSVVTSALITQSPSGSVVTFTDNTTGLVGTITRTLAVYDDNGNLLANPVFSGNVATYDITSDIFMAFVENITDDNGSYTQTLHYQSTAFFENSFSNAIAGVTSPYGNDSGTIYNLNLAMDYYMACLRFFIGGFGVSAQNMITQANFYVSTPFYSL